MLSTCEGSSKPKEVQLALEVLVKHYRNDAIMDSADFPGLQQLIHKIDHAVYRVRVERLPDEYPTWTRMNPTVEALAENIYTNNMQYEDPKPVWVPYGDSLKQDKAREIAREVLSRAKNGEPPLSAALTTPAVPGEYTKGNLDED